jgi:hypothetical protein
MIVALWITAVLLTIVYLFSGVVKVVRSRAQLEPMMGWVAAATTWQVKVVGILEVLGAIGVILPLATGIAPVVTAIAAICLALVQVVAIPIHVRRKDTLASMSFNVVLLLLAVAVAVLRFATL